MIAQYFKEKDGAETIVSGKSFLAYIANAESGECYISEFHLDPEHRHSPKHFISLMREINERAKASQCSFLSCAVPMSHLRRSEVLLTYLKFGFTLHSLEASRIVLVKDLKEKH